MPGQSIRIKLKAYDHHLIDKSSDKIITTAKTTGALISGPIPLPTKRSVFTVLRSPHVDKKSREQFEIHTHKRLVEIREPTARTIEALNRLVVPAGVFVKIKT